jgi:hypothetical protein
VNRLEHFILGHARNLWHVFVLTPFLLIPAASHADDVTREINIGASSVRITGPWKFHIGDDAAWARPDLDDRAWEVVDLTAPEGARDQDVGYSGYVPGWSLRGHKGYSGYAWYRTSITVRAPVGAQLALAGPAAVESAYQLFVDGVLAGGSGRFGGSTPTVFSILPKVFPLHLAYGNPSDQTITLAIRVWLSPRMAEGDDYGGLHVAPLIGTQAAISDHYELQWFEIFRGYIVDAVLAAVLILLGVFALQMRSIRWMGAALVMTGLVRGNQATYFWFQFESLTTFDVVRNVLLVPLILGTWAIAWQSLLQIRRPRRLATAFGVLTALGVVAQTLSVAFVSSGGKQPMPQFIVVLDQSWRLLFILGFGYLFFRCITHRQPAWIVSAIAMLLLSVGLFAAELSAIGVPGIWFPFGTGVSRTQYAFAALALTMPTLMLRHLRESILSRGATDP